MRIVDGIDGVCLVRPCRVLLQRLVELVVEGPAQPQPVPEPVQRDRLEQPALRGRHLAVKFRVRRRPLRRALNDSEGSDLVRNGRDDLHCAHAVTDHDDALVFQVDAAFRPACRMRALAAETVDPGNVRILRFVEGADRADQSVCAQGFALAVRQSQVGYPARRVFIEAGLEHFSAKKNVAPDVERIGNMVQVRVDLVPAREVLGPLVRCERKRVEMTRDVARRARIVILQPDTADGIVAFDDRIGNAGARQLVRAAEARDARANNENVEVLARRRARFMTDRLTDPDGRIPVR